VGGLPHHAAPELSNPCCPRGSRLPDHRNDSGAFWLVPSLDQDKPKCRAKSAADEGPLADVADAAGSALCLRLPAASWHQSYSPCHVGLPRQAADWEREGGRCQS